jgi:hypothetical protein
LFNGNGKKLYSVGVRRKNGYRALMELCRPNKTEARIETPGPVPQCPPQIQHEHCWHWTRFPRGKIPATNRLSHDMALQYNSYASIADRNCFERLKNYKLIEGSFHGGQWLVTMNLPTNISWELYIKGSSVIRGIQQHKNVSNRPYIGWNIRNVVNFAIRKINKEKLRDLFLFILYTSK